MRKTAETTDTPKQTVEDKLDEIILYLHRMERRDRARMIGSYIHGMVWLASILLLIWSTWYFIAYGPQLIEEMTTKMIQQSMGGQASSENAGSLMEQLQQYMGR
jgi:hypothetical protein